MPPEDRTIAFETIDAQWYRACGTRTLRSVIVREPTGNIGIRVFFCTDPTVGPARVLETYAMRWGIEVCFRELEQHFAFADSSARTRQAVERTASFVGVLSSCVVLFAADVQIDRRQATIPTRPWSRQKRGLSFEEVLRIVRADLHGSGVLDPLSDFDGSRNRSRSRASARQHAERVA